MVFRGEARRALLQGLEQRFAHLEAPTLVRVQGPAGSGRSRFLAELYERLAATQVQPYWPSLGADGRAPEVARDLHEDHRLELAPAHLEGLAGLIPEHLWLAVHGTTMPSPFSGGRLVRVEQLGLLEAQLESHVGPLLRSIESRFATADALRIGKFVLNFIPGLSALSPLIEAGELRDLAARMAPSRRDGAARRALAAADVVDVSAQPDATDVAERLAKAIASLTGEEKGIPGVIAVDDADLADPATVHTLAQLLRSSSRVLIVATTRTEPWDGLDVLPPFDTLVADLRERRPARLEEHDLPALEREELRAIIVDRCPGAHGAGIDQVLDAAGDNPLVLHAVLVSSGVQRALLEGDAISRRLIASLPRSVESVFGRIWEALETEVQEAFALASLQGNPFDAAWVRSLPVPIPSGLDRGQAEHGLVDIEPIGSALLGRFRRSWVELRAREALRSECEDDLLAAAVPTYLTYVEERITEDGLATTPPGLVRALLSAYVALGVGDGLVEGRHATSALDRAGLLLARAEDQLRRVDVAYGVLQRVRASGVTVGDDVATAWAILEAQLLRRLGRPTEALTALDGIRDAQPEDALHALVLRIACASDAYLDVDVEAAIAQIRSALDMEDARSPISPSLRGEACVALVGLVDATTRSALGSLEEFSASQEPHLDHAQQLRLRSRIAGANARVGNYRRARDLWLAIEDEVGPDPSLALIPGFRSDYASWLPVVGEFRRGVDLMRTTWERDAEVLSASYPTALTGRQNLLYWLVEGGEVDPAAAAEEYAAIAARMGVTMESDHPTLRNVRINHALMLLKGGQFPEAQEAIDRLRTDPVDDETVARGVRLDIYEAQVRAGLGDATGALELARRGHEKELAWHGPTAWNTQVALCVRVRLEEPGTALDLIEEALVDAGPLEEALNPAVMRLMAERARIRRDADELALVLARQDEVLGRSPLGAPHEDVVRTRSDLADLQGSSADAD